METECCLSPWAVAAEVAYAATAGGAAGLDFSTAGSGWAETCSQILPLLSLQLAENRNISGVGIGSRLLSSYRHWLGWKAL